MASSRRAALHPDSNACSMLRARAAVRSSLPVLALADGPANRSTSAIRSAMKVAGIAWPMNCAVNGPASRAKIRPAVMSEGSVWGSGRWNLSSRPGVFWLMARAVRPKSSEPAEQRLPRQSALLEPPRARPTFETAYVPKSRTAASTVSNCSRAWLDSGNLLLYVTPKLLNFTSIR